MPKIPLTRILLAGWLAGTAIVAAPGCNSNGTTLEGGADAASDATSANDGSGGGDVTNGNDGAGAEDATNGSDGAGGPDATSANDGAGGDATNGNDGAGGDATSVIDSASPGDSMADADAAPPVACPDGGVACTDGTICSVGITTSCVVGACTAAGCCSMTDESVGTPCTDNGGQYCDGNGHCVACNKDSDCPASSSVCATPTCDPKAHTCGATHAMKGLACTLTAGGAGICDGNGNCTNMHCTDGVKDGDETDVDCGGATCPACGDTEGCLVGSDCKDKVCTGASAPTEGVCAYPSCSDGFQNGNETDVDCGGTAYVEPGDAGTLAACKACADTKHCTGNTDCVSINCVSLICTAKALGVNCTTAAECGTGNACVPDDTNTDNTICCATSCTAASTATCGADGNCKHDGSACADYSSATRCLAPSCSGNVFTAAALCTGTGSCPTGTATTCAGADPVCNASLGCVQCNVNADCTSGVCSNHVCTLESAGQSCTASSECASGLCGPTGAGTHCCAAAITCSATVAACAATDCDTTGACVFPGTTVAPASLQTPGDCQEVVCNGSGGVTSVDAPVDIPTSNSACLINPACCGPSPLTPCFTSAPTGTPCTFAGDPHADVCGDTTNSNIAGTCVECNTNTDCTGNPNGAICDTVTGACVQCNVNSDCASGVCNNNVCTLESAGQSCSASSQCGSGLCGPTGAGTHCCAAAITCSATVAACAATDCDTTGACVFPGNTVAPASLQTPGDCQQVVCDGHGNATSVDNATDLPTSDSACLIDPSCCGPSPLTPCFASAPTGTPCTLASDPDAIVCGDTTNSDIAGTCVECNGNTDCNGDPNGPTCDTSMGVCGP